MELKFVNIIKLEQSVNSYQIIIKPNLILIITSANPLINYLSY